MAGSEPFTIRPYGPRPGYSIAECVPPPTFGNNRDADHQFQQTATEITAHVIRLGTESSLMA